MKGATAQQSMTKSCSGSFINAATRAKKNAQIEQITKTNRSTISVQYNKSRGHNEWI
jgi:hypothetical protein